MPLLECEERAPLVPKVDLEECRIEAIGDALPSSVCSGRSVAFDFGARRQTRLKGIERRLRSCLLNESLGGIKKSNTAMTEASEYSCSQSPNTIAASSIHGIGAESFSRKRRTGWTDTSCDRVRNRLPRAFAPLTDQRVLVAAVKFRVDLCGIRHEFARVLHVRVCEQRVVGCLFVRGSIGMMFYGFMIVHRRALSAPIPTAHSETYPRTAASLHGTSGSRASWDSSARRRRIREVVDEHHAGFNAARNALPARLVVGKHRAAEPVLRRRNSSTTFQPTRTHRYRRPALSRRTKTFASRGND